MSTDQELLEWAAKAAVEPIKAATTPNEMRAEFERLSFYDPLVHAVFDVARYGGLSGEDKFTILAYEAIKQLKAMQRLNLDYARSSVCPMLIPKEPQ